ncbi:MAG: hypothetical protein U1E95_04945 [Rubrivivax sp.]
MPAVLSMRASACPPRSIIAVASATRRGDDGAGKSRLDLETARPRPPGQAEMEMDRRTTLKSRWQARRGTAVMLRDIGAGALELSHNSLALVDLAVLLSMAYVAGNTELRTDAETWLSGLAARAAGVRADEADDPAPSAIGASAPIP